MPQAQSNETRFQRWVEITGFCWLWTSVPTTDGYCQTWVDGRRQMAHRWVYEWLVGPIPAGVQLDHLCRIRNCVNPDHVEMVSNAVNCQRGLNSYAIRRVCAQGHDMTDPTNWRKRGDRIRCRRCALDAQRKTRYGAA